jgi:outer membrane receptor protein involved in Fe transport
MKTFIFTILYVCLATIAFSQTTTSTATVKGVVTDSVKNAPLSYITIALTDSVTKQPVKSSLTKEDGTFELKGVPVKAYLLTVIAVGYQPKVIAISFKTDSSFTVNLGQILLSASNNQLKEVGITAAKPLIKQEIDRMVYDVQADPDSKALTAMDMMRRTPLLSVDGDDNIQLLGSSSYRIFINGKPSALLAANPKDVLRAMPASNIQRIEVITTPPSKYDSEGLAGIINIVTIKKADDGYNGTITTRYNYPWGPNVNLTGTYKKSKFGLSGYVGLGKQLNVTQGSDNFRETFSPQGTSLSRLIQNGNNSFGGTFFYASAEMSYELDTLHLITASLNRNDGRFNDNYERNTLYTYPTGQQSYNLLSDGGNSWTGTDISLNYQIGFKRNKQQLLTTSYRYQYNSNGQHSDVLALNRVNYNNPDYNQQNDAGAKEHTAQLDYVHPAKQLTIEAGAKAIFRNNFSIGSGQTASLIGGQTQFVNDINRANNFDYQQDVYSLYNSYQLKLTKWTFKAGVRAEHTRVDANFVTNNATLHKNYTNVVPSLSVMRTLKNNQSLTFGYTNRLERPGIYQLNPFVNRSNSQIFSSGNPNLSPVLSYLTELTYSKSAKGSFTAKVSYLYTGNSIISALGLINDTSLTTYANAGKLKVIRLNLAGNVPLGKKLNINYNTGLFHVDISGQYGERFYHNSGLRTNSSLNVSYKPTDTWTLGLNGGYNRRYINLQGSSNDFYYSSLSAAKSFFDKKFTITAVVRNLDRNKYSFTQYTDTPELYQSTTDLQYYRGFSFSLSYKFGKLSSDIKKNQRNINNDDVKSGGASSK